MSFDLLPEEIKNKILIQAKLLEKKVLILNFQILILRLKI